MKDWFKIITFGEGRNDFELRLPPLKLDFDNSVSYDEDDKLTNFSPTTKYAIW